MGLLTVWDALEIVVGLRDVQLGTDPLVIDLVLDVAQQDKCRHHARILARLDRGLDVAVPHVDRRRQNRTAAVGGHRQEHVPVAVDHRRALGHPVATCRVAQVVADVYDVVKGVHRHGLGRAHGRGHTSIERIRRTGVAPPQAVCADATHAIFWWVRVVSDILPAGTHRTVRRNTGPLAGGGKRVGRNSREQQGVSSGHLLSRPHVCWSSARTGSAPRRAAPSGISVRSMVKADRRPENYD